METKDVAIFAIIVIQLGYIWYLQKKSDFYRDHYISLIGALKEAMENATKSH